MYDMDVCMGFVEMFCTEPTNKVDTILDITVFAHSLTRAHTFTHMWHASVMHAEHASHLRT